MFCSFCLKSKKQEEKNYGYHGSEIDKKLTELVDSYIIVVEL